MSGCFCNTTTNKTRFVKVPFCKSYKLFNKICMRDTGGALDALCKYNRDTGFDSHQCRDRALTGPCIDLNNRLWLKLTAADRKKRAALRPPLRGLGINRCKRGTGR